MQQTSTFPDLNLYVESVQLNKECAYLIIVDEAHWGPRAKGMLDARINNNILLKADNVFTLLITATPYNVVTTALQNHKDHIIIWEKVTEVTFTFFQNV